ncbi:hypothetical protein SNE40_023125 [Patella caerulea]|uniref:Uncharacterized protein n=1 Tax=Patella caerulea TaxID=87958 RepID=A0AAN8GG63_PATCE
MNDIQPRPRYFWNYIYFPSYRNYVDNPYNRRLGRVGMPHGTMIEYGNVIVYERENEPENKMTLGQILCCIVLIYCFVMAFWPYLLLILIVCVIIGIIVWANR